MITHVVSLTLTNSADRAETRSRLEALPAHIAELRSLVVGVDEGGDPAAADVVLISTHHDLAGLKAYQDHPAHQDFLSWVRPRLASRVVVDFAS